MIRKIIYYLVSLLLVVILSLFLLECTLQLIPIISRNVPLSKDKVYIYIIGESSSEGQPYYLANISYYKILNYIIDGKIDGKPIEFIKIAHFADRLNMQYLRYFVYRYTHPFKKGLAFIYAGKNDWDNGKDIKQTKKYGIKTFDFMANILSKKNNFLYDYENLISIVKEFGDDAFVATIEGNYSGFMPHLDAENILYKEKFNEIDDEILINKNYKKAELMLKELEQKEDSDKSWIYYRYGKILEFTGNIKEANDFFIKDIALYYNLIPSKYEIDCIRDLVSKHNLMLVDIFDKIYNSGEIIGFNFYKDNQHPDLRLYIIIAELFVDALQKKYGNKINIKNVKDKDICEYFKFDEENKFKVYILSLDVTLFFSKFNGNTNRFVYEQVDEYLNKIIELNPYKGEEKQAIDSFYSMLVEALKGNKDKVIEIYNNNNEIIKNNKHVIYVRYGNSNEYNQWLRDFLEINDSLL